MSFSQYGRANADCQVDLELKNRHEILGNPGKVMLTAFETRARLGCSMRPEAPGSPVDIAATRQLRDRGGADFNLEQALAHDLGMFARAGEASGNVEAYDFTDFDRTVAVGLSIPDRSRSSKPITIWPWCRRPT